MDLRVNLKKGAATLAVLLIITIMGAWYASRYACVCEGAECNCTKSNYIAVILSGLAYFGLPLALIAYIILSVIEDKEEMIEKRTEKD